MTRPLSLGSTATDNTDSTSWLPSALEEPELECLVSRVATRVQLLMSAPPFDISHDFTHIQRVVRLAKTLAEDHERLNPQLKINMLIVVLLAMLHDIGDRKYPLPGLETPASIIIACSGSQGLASTIQELAENLGFSCETENPEKVAALVQAHPELGIVQDADRLDAVGAVGIARIFAFSALRGISLAKTRAKFEELLLPRIKVMKTELGREMAVPRAEAIRKFGREMDMDL